MNVRRSAPAAFLFAAAMLFATAGFAQPFSDVMVMKTGPATAAAGANVAYDVMLTNLGPDPTDVLTLSDAIPAGMTFVSEVQNSGPAFTCTNPAVGAGGTISCTLPTLASGQSADFTITLQITADAAAGTFFVNTATVSTATDPSPENDSSVAVTNTPFPPQTDLSVTKTGPTGAGPGTTATYTITLANAGAADAQTVTLTDALPASFPGGAPMTFVSISQSGGPAFSCTTPAVGASGTITCTAATLPASTSVTFTLVGQVPANAPVGSTYTNIAGVTTATPDPNPENDSGATTLTVAASDVAVTKSGPATALAGGSATYSITVANNGPDTATNVSVADPLPAGTVFTSMSSTGVPATCSTPPSGTNGTVFCSWPILGNGQSSTLTLNVGIAATVANGTTITNTATVSSDSADPNAGNNSSSTSATVSSQADLSAVKSGPATATAGTTVTYTIAVANAGPSNAAAATLTDTLPAGATFVSLTQTSGPVFSCSTPAVGSGGTVNCGSASFAAGATAGFSLVATAPAAAPNGTVLSNTATISSTTADPNGGNNSSTAATTLSVSADLAVTKSGPASIAAGANVTYTIVASNNGPSYAAGVSLTDSVPANTTFVSLTQTGGPAFSCTTPAAGGTGAITCTAATLSAGSPATFSLVVAAGNTLATGATITNTATISGASTDPLPANNTATATSTVGTGAADVSITKTAASRAQAGLPIAYTITVANAGPSPAQSVVVTDALPAGTTFVSATPSQGTCSGTSTVTCQLGTIINGASATIALTVNAPSTAGNITNTATVAAAGPDTVLANNTATATVEVVPTNAIPTLSGAALMLLALGLAIAASLSLRR